MARLLLFLITLIALPGFISGQSLELINAPTDPISVNSADNEFTVYFNLKNTTGSALNVAAARIENNRAPGQHSYFCWDFCYDTTFAGPSGPISIDGGDTTDTEQYVTLVTGNVGGYTEVTMRFINEANTNDFVEHTYRFSTDGVTSLEDDIDGARALSAPYPHPARGVVNFDYSLPIGTGKSNLVVYNLIGSRVMQQPLSGSEGKAVLNVEKLQSGVYFVNLELNGRKVTSRKLIVVR